jgi:hypothetical protein
LVLSEVLSITGQYVADYNHTISEIAQFLITLPFSETSRPV